MPKVLYVWNMWWRAYVSQIKVQKVTSFLKPSLHFDLNFTGICIWDWEYAMRTKKTFTSFSVKAWKRSTVRH